LTWSYVEERATVYVGHMREERLLIGEVPTRQFTPDGAYGLLLLGHGGGQGKDGDRFVRLCRSYAAQTGLSVVCIDALDHGERRVEDSTEGVPSGWHSRTMPRMVADWQSVVEHLSSLGPPVAYVGFSMGAIFGFPTVAAMPNIRAAVFVVGGIPGSDWTQDPDLAPSLISAASRLNQAHVLMLNKSEDGLFAVHGVHQVFDSVVARSKQLVFWPGGHDEWGEDLIDRSVSFIKEQAGAEEVGELG
jgi:pimeloyl-ACP methyl ester carboxylesterase